MKKITYLAVLLFLSTITGATVAWSLDLSGKILDIVTENAIPDTTVDLWNYDDRTKQSFTSDALGAFMFGGLISGGHYHLIATHDGYIDASSDTLNPYANMSDFVLDLIPPVSWSELLPGFDPTAGYVLGYVKLLNAIDTGVENVTISVTDMTDNPITGASILYLDETNAVWDKAYTSKSGQFIIVIPESEMTTEINPPVGYPTPWKDMKIKGQRADWIIATGPWTRVFQYSATVRNIVTLYETTGEGLSTPAPEEANDDGGGGGGGGGCFIATAI